MRFWKFSRLWDYFTGQKKRLPLRWRPVFTSPHLERLEDRLSPSVTAALDGSHVLNINLNAAGDAATVSLVGPNIQVTSGTNALVFSGPAASVFGINAQGTVAPGAGTFESLTLNGPSAVSVAASNLSNLNLVGFYADPLARDTITIASPAPG
jgi:hypothetical protein